MHRKILFSLLFVLGVAILGYRLVRAQSPPVLPIIEWYASYQFHVLNHPTGISALPYKQGTGGLRTAIFIADTDNNLIRRFEVSSGTLTILAGTGTPGLQDGPAYTAQFNRPAGLHGSVRIWGDHTNYNSSFAISVDDMANHALRLICAGPRPQVGTCSGYPQNTVITQVGMSGVEGYVDGTASVARLSKVGGVLGLSAGTYITDAGNHALRYFDGTNVSTYAGTGQAGFVNGYRTSAKFNVPTSSVVTNSNMYISDTGNNVIRRIDPNGNVTTFAGTGTPGYQNGTGSQAKFSWPTNVVYNVADGYFYVADAGNNMIRRIDSAGNVSLYAGATTPGLVDGSLLQARFASPTALSIQGGFMYISDSMNNAIRRIDMANGIVSTYIN